MELSRELEWGRAAEHLVVADLILKNCPAFLTTQGFPYDVICHSPIGLLRIQVRSTQTLRWVNRDREFFTKQFPTYTFKATRTGRKGKKLIKVGTFDLFSLVVFDKRIIAYVPFTKELRTNFTLRSKQISYRRRADEVSYIEDLTWEKCLEAITHYEESQDDSR